MDQYREEEGEEEEEEELDDSCEANQFQAVKIETDFEEEAEFDADADAENVETAESFPGVGSGNWKQTVSTMFEHCIFCYEALTPPSSRRQLQLNDRDSNDAIMDPLAGPSHDDASTQDPLELDERYFEIIGKYLKVNGVFCISLVPTQHPTALYLCYVVEI